MIYSLLEVYLNLRAYDFFSKGHPRTQEVSLILSIYENRNELTNLKREGVFCNVFYSVEKCLAQLSMASHESLIKIILHLSKTYKGTTLSNLLK